MFFFPVSNNCIKPHLEDRCTSHSKLFLCTLSLFHSLCLETWEQACVYHSLSLSPWADHPHKETPCCTEGRNTGMVFFWWMGLADYHLCQCQNHKPALAKEGERDIFASVCLTSFCSGIKAFSQYSCLLVAPEAVKRLSRWADWVSCRSLFSRHILSV